MILWVPSHYSYIFSPIQFEILEIILQICLFFGFIYFFIYFLFFFDILFKNIILSIIIIAGTVDEVKLLLKESDVRVDCLDEVNISVVSTLMKA